MNQVLTETNSNKITYKTPGLTGPVFVAYEFAKAPAFTLAGSDSYPAYTLVPEDIFALEQFAAGKGVELRAELLTALSERSLLREGLTPVAATGGQPPSSRKFALDRDEKVALVRPFILRLDSKGYSYLDHSGNPLIVMSAREMAAALQFGQPFTPAKVFKRQKEQLGKVALNRWSFSSLTKRLAAAGLIQEADQVTALENHAKREYAEVMRVASERAGIVRESLVKLQEEEAIHQQKTGKPRTKVIPVQKEAQPLLSHGLLMSYAMDFEEGRLCDHYQFIPDWCNLTIPSLTGDEPPAVYIFSNYIWSHTSNMALSQQAKDANPNNICIHGGPDTPKYEGDIKRYLELNPHVDVIVHGEGEATFTEILDAIKEQFETGQRDLTVLKNVTGLTYRIGNTLVTTEARPQITDLNTIPSPYSNGMFSNIGDLPIIMQTIETNRGCPFGCTFCDWGSATLSKIRKYDLERVFSDLEWCAKNRVKVVFNTDANFGVFERDVEIAQKVVELKEKYGYPRVFESSYAKNRVNHLKKIIEILAGGGVVSTGTLSLQSVDPETLSAIKRSNIKVSKYDELAVEFGRAKLPLIVEMMMGLPGSTLESFEGDLQQAIDREVHARVNPTEVLVNSPMNEPDYRTEFDINLQRPIEEDWKSENGQTPPEKALIISTTSFTAEEYREMEDQRQLFILMENYGVLRQVARFVRHETGKREMRFYVDLHKAMLADPTRWPTVTFTLQSMKGLMVQPGSWHNFLAEIRDYLVTELGLADDSALETVLKVQHALLPARDRSFPLHLNLPHDYARWHQEMLSSKQSGWENDWTRDVKPLKEFGPGTFTVDDSQKLTTLGMGTPMLADIDLDWEFESSIGRALRYRRAAEYA